MWQEIKQGLRKTWFFLWKDDSLLSWVVSIIVAFILIQFVFYPGLGFLMGTPYPVVAVVSSSMEHRASSSGQVQDVLGRPIVQQGALLCGQRVDDSGRYTLSEWWEVCGDWYEEHTSITLDDFRNFPFRNGFNRGDIIFLRGKHADAIAYGDVLVYQTQQPYPIIHRVVAIHDQSNGLTFTTKGDNNPDIIRRVDYEEHITEEQLLGVAYFRIPYIGYVKIVFVEYLVQPIVSFLNR